MTKNLERPKRLSPTGETLRELFLKSGNLCAYPGCDHLMMNANGVFIGQICHIEAAERGGQRFNPGSTNEERRQAKNLMLMCHAHHKITDKSDTYSLQKLREIKRRHETRFSAPERAMMDQLKDWTKSAELSVAKNLRRFCRVLKLRMDSEDLESEIADLAAYVAQLKKVPLGVREYLRAVVQRTYDMQKSNVVVPYGDSLAILVSDLNGALQISQNAVVTRARELRSYGLGDIVEIEDDDFRKDVAVQISGLDSGRPLWMDLARYCKRSSIDLGSLAIDLDFAQLDE